MAPLLLIMCLVLCYVSFRFRHRRMEALAAKISGPPAWPLIGNALQLLGSTHGKGRYSFSASPYFHLILYLVACPLSVFVLLTASYRCTGHHIPPTTTLPDAGRVLAGTSSLRGRRASCKHRGKTRCLCYTSLSALQFHACSLSPGCADEPPRPGEGPCVPLLGALVGTWYLHCPR
jgi:hypothetical protein